MKKMLSILICVSDHFFAIFNILGFERHRQKKFNKNKIKSSRKLPHIRYCHRYIQNWQYKKSLKNFIVFWSETKFITGLNDHNIFKGKNKNNANKGPKKTHDN